MRNSRPSEERKVALVTAATKGMGLAVSKQLAREGYRLVLMARSPEVKALAQELGGVALQGDTSRNDDLEALVQLAVTSYGRIDAVVANTGHATRGELLAISDEAWHSNVDLLLLHVVRLSRLVAPLMQKQGSGSFVNISTYAAFEPSLDFPVSSVLRAALGSFAKLFADRYARDGLRMNNVLPGYIDSYQPSAEVVATIPMGRVGTTNEVASVVAFLLSTQAAYVNGQNIRVDGGLAKYIS